jgi:hypothetical protein
MSIKTDNSAVIATLNKRIQNLERYNAGLANESCEQQRKIADLEAKVIHSVELNDFMSDRGIITRTQAAAKIKELEAKIIEIEGIKVTQ